MIVWRGWGFAVVIFLGLFYFLARTMTGPGPLDAKGEEGFNTLALGIGAALSAVATFGLYAFLAGRGGDGKDSFWFIPLKFWPIIFGVVSIVAFFLSFTRR